MSGKYDFPGIKRLGGASLRLIIAPIPHVGWIANTFVGVFITDMLANFLANRGLMLLNIGGFYVTAEFNQMDFDKAMEAGINEVESKEGKLSSADTKRIDDEVMRVARRYLRITRA